MTLLRNPVFQDVFGDFVCGVVQDMHRYWSQFAIMDTRDAVQVSDAVLTILKKLVTVQQVPHIEHDENDINDNEFAREPAA